MKDDKVYIQHILESIELIEQYVAENTKDSFISQPQLQDAVLRRLEIIGEATKNVSADVKEQHPDVPWRLMAGMRDILIHHYFGVDIDLVWNTVKKDLPQVKQLLEAILHGKG